MQFAPKAGGTTDIRQPGRGRSLGKAGWVAYLTTGVTLAVSRVSMLIWWWYHFSAHTDPNYELHRNAHDAITWVLHPELMLGATTLLPIAAVHDDTLRLRLLASLVATGSFIMATPILLLLGLDSGVDRTLPAGMRYLNALAVGVGAAVAGTVVWTAVVMRAGGIDGVAVELFSPPTLLIQSTCFILGVYWSLRRSRRIAAQ